MPPKLKVRPPKEDEGELSGVPPPNDGPRDVAININRRSKMTVKGEREGTPPSDGSANDDSTLAASAQGCVGAVVSFTETTGAPKQTSVYLSSLSALEQRVCSIAESHLESSFDLSRSTGYLSWISKNGVA